MPKYADDPAWADVEPIAQNEGGSHPLAAIAYGEEYSEAMAYLRAVMAKDDLSERVLDLTKDIIIMNPSHYTVWLYRAKVIKANNRSLRDELNWVNAIALKHEKNYQIWQYRQTIVDQLNSADGETEFLAQMFDSDSKNYHVWSYRQWLVRRFDLWDAGELQGTASLIEQDVRNNSAWNHRWFVTFGRPGNVHEDVVMNELKFAKDAIRRAPQNQSPWNYARGILRFAKLPLSTLEPFSLELAPLDSPDNICSSHALDLVADINAEKANKSGRESALKAWEMLATIYDPIRKKYWNYRQQQLQQAITT